MASLVGQQLKDTYDSLLKTSDNDALGGTYKEITDGSGNGSGLYLGTGGSVGIGGSPATKLQIDDTVDFSVALSKRASTTSALKFTLSDPNSTDFSWKIEHDASENLNIYGYSQDDLVISSDSTERMKIMGSSGDISFRDTSSNEAFYWDASTARLGIGTTSPAVELDVNGEITADDKISINSSANTEIVLQGGAEQDAILKLTESGYSGARLMYDGGDNKLYIGMGTGDTFATKMTFLRDSLGVGIGTTSPDTLLEIDGGFSFEHLKISSSNNTSRFMKIGLDDATNHTIEASGSGCFLTFKTGATPTEKVRIDASGNLLVGGTTVGTNSAGNIVLFNGTAPSGNVTNGVTLYAQDVSSSSELKVRDEAGNVTTLSPHNFSLIPDGASEPMAWAYYSERDGKKINVDMLKLARMVESLTGEKLVYEQ